VGDGSIRPVPPAHLAIRKRNLNDTLQLSNVRPFCVHATVPPLFNDAVSTSNCPVHCHLAMHRFHYKLHSKTEKTSPKCRRQSESNQLTVTRRTVTVTLQAQCAMHLQYKGRNVIQLPSVVDQCSSTLWTTGRRRSGTRSVSTATAADTTVRITVNRTACSTQHDTECRTAVLQCATTCFGNYWPSSDEHSRHITEGAEAFTLPVIFIVNLD